VGVAEIVSPAYPAPGEKVFYNVDVAPRYRLPRPVSLAQIKKNPIFAGWELVRLPRLSVMPATPEYWSEIHSMGASEPEN